MISLYIYEKNCVSFLSVCSKFLSLKDYSLHFCEIFVFYENPKEQLHLTHVWAAGAAAPVAGPAAAALLAQLEASSCSSHRQLGHQAELGTEDVSRQPAYQGLTFPAGQKPNSWTCNFLAVSGHNLERSQTWGFRVQCLHYKPVLNHFCWGGGGNPGNKGKLLRLFSKNLASAVFAYEGMHHRVHTEWQPPLSVRTFHHYRKISPGWWVWGIHAHPPSLYSPSRTKLQCTLQLSGQIHSVSSLSIYVLSGTHSLTTRVLRDVRFKANISEY